MNITANNLSVNFNDTIALNSINFETNSNRIAIIGQNGSGKTTLLSLIAGLLKPDRGFIRVNESDPYKSREHTIQKVSFLFEKLKFPYRIKVSEFIAFLKSAQNFDDEHIEKLVNSLGVDTLLEKYLHSLSSGEEQLLSILNLLCSPANILLLDEPFTHLDIFRISQIYEEILNIKQNMVLTTHIPEEAEAIGNYFIILDQGKIVWSGTKLELITSDIYEVQAIFAFPDSIKPIYRYGNTALVKSTSAELYELLLAEKIMGFRKSGIRRVYNEIKTGNKVVH
ncbi:MAG: ATP-binding cassette domain-containing protein [Thermoplasmataceae archaeon]